MRALLARVPPLYAVVARALPLLTVVACALVVVGCVAPSPVVPTPSPTREPGTLTVTALLDLSGPRASLGNAQRNALQIWADQQQVRGTRQLRLRWKAVDVAGSEARLIVELRRASENDGADAVIVGTPLARYGDNLLRATELARLPILLTLPAPEPPLGGGRWLFALAPGQDRLDALVPADLAARGITEPPFRLVPPGTDVIHYPAQLGGVRAMRLSGAPKEYPQLAALLKQVVPAPIAYFSYLTDPNELGDLKDAPLVALWPGSRQLVGGSPAFQSPARRDFVKAYADRHGPPATWAATAFDALALIAAAAERSAATAERSTIATRESIRDRLEGTSMVGIASRYGFSRSTHAGPLADDFVLLRWSGSFVTAAAR